MFIVQRLIARLEDLQENLSDLQYAIQKETKPTGKAPTASSGSLFSRVFGRAPATPAGAAQDLSNDDMFEL